MKNKKFIGALAIACLLVIGLTSCSPSDSQETTVVTGPKGETGDTGPKGEQGEKGETGEQGAQGQPGKDGQDGDKGETGDKGDKGETGEAGEDGVDGKDVWGNTIIPSVGGSVTDGTKTGLVGENITFTITPDEGYFLDKFYVDNQLVDGSLVPYENGVYTYSTLMKENGFVVRAVFDDTLTPTYYEDGQLYTNALIDGFGNVLDKGEATQGIKFESGSGTLEDPLIVDVSKTSMLDGLSDEQMKVTAFKVDLSRTKEDVDAVFALFERDTLGVEVILNAGTTYEISDALMSRTSNLTLTGTDADNKPVISKEGSTSGSAFIINYNDAKNVVKDINITITNVDFENFDNSIASAFINIADQEDATINLENVSYKGNEGTSTVGAYGIQILRNTGDVELNINNSSIDLAYSEDGSLKRSYYGLNLQNNTGLVANITNTYIRAWGNVYIKDNNDIINIDNCEFVTVNNVSDKRYSFSSIVFDGGAIVDEIEKPAGVGNTVNVSNTTFNLVNTEGYRGLNYFAFQYEATKNTIKLDNNTYINGEDNYDNNVSLGVFTEDDNTIIVVEDGVETVINFHEDFKVVVQDYSDEEIASGTLVGMILPDGVGLVKVLSWTYELDNGQSGSTTNAAFTVEGKVVSGSLQCLVGFEGLYTTDGIPLIASIGLSF